MLNLSPCQCRVEAIIHTYVHDVQSLQQRSIEDDRILACGSAGT